MAAKTPHYGLNQWAADDVFIRTDFNEDNVRIEAALTAKADTTATDAALAVKANAIDVTAALAAKANTGDVNAALATKCGIVCGRYQGNGTGSNSLPQITQKIHLGFFPKAVFICHELGTYQGAKLITQAIPKTNYVVLESDGFTVIDAMLGLNLPNTQYDYIAFQ